MIIQWERQKNARVRSDRVPKELWMEVRDIIQEAVIKTIPKKKKCKKTKQLSVEALQIAEKRTEVKGQGEKERYTHLNTEFQRTARRNKPFSVIKAKKQRKTIEQERLGSLQENQRYQGNISCKDGHNKGQKWYGTNRNRRY